MARRVVVARRRVGAAAFVAAAFLAVATPSRALMNWPDLLGRPLPQANERIPYGSDALQFADLWLPTGAGPHTLVIMVHGGCWQSDIAKASIMNYLAEDLRRRGVAVWNIEYRGVDRPGGGYPGTFADVATAADAVRRVAAAKHLKLDRVVVVGHSAGGHLALWLAARPGLPRTSPLRSADPLPVSTAFSLGGLPDLEAAESPPGDTCGGDTVQALTGPRTPAHADPLADTSPAALPAPRARIVLVNADRDPIAPPAFAGAYAERMARKGNPPERHVVAGEGHVELIAPGSHAWALERGLIMTALGAPDGEEAPSAGLRLVESGATRR